MRRDSRRTLAAVQLDMPVVNMPVAALISTSINKMQLQSSGWWEHRTQQALYTFTA